MEENMSMEDTEEVKMLKAQINQLQAEVEVLQRQQQDKHKEMTLLFSNTCWDAL